MHRVRGELVAGALRLIEQGALDHASMGDLARRIGVGERHLRRIFAVEVGASPNEVAATRRLLFAKQLLAETALPITTIASAAGYASLRRFNAAFSAAYGKPPRAIRRGLAAPTANELLLRLPYRQPYDFAGLRDFLGRRAIPRIEAVDANSYRRSFMADGKPGWFAVELLPGEAALALRIHHASTKSLGEIAARVRRMFDVDADPRAIAATLRCSVLLKPLLRRWAGQRLPGAWDGFELAVRAVLGQQVSVAAARTLAARLVDRYGTPFAEGSAVGLDALFPGPEHLVEAPLEEIGVMRARATTIRNLAEACLDRRIGFGIEQSLPAFAERLCELSGIGSWTAQYIALRALSHPDAFPAGDLVLRRVAGNGVALSARALETASVAWRPWRAYAVMLLWRAAA